LCGSIEFGIIIVQLFTVKSVKNASSFSTTNYFRHHFIRNGFIAYTGAGYTDFQKIINLSKPLLTLTFRKYCRKIEKQL